MLYSFLKQVNSPSKIIPAIMVLVTNRPRHLPDITWSTTSWTHNIFRFYELIFWRRNGIRREAMSYIENSVEIHKYFTLEAKVAGFESWLRRTLSFTVIRVYVPLLAIAGMNNSSLIQPYYLAIALDSANNGTATGTSPLTFSHTCTGSNLILTVTGAVFSATTSSIGTSTTYNSAAMTSVDTLKSWGSGGGCSLRCFYKTSPSTGSNTVSMGFSGTTPTANAVAVSYSGVKQSGQPDAVFGTTSGLTTSSFFATVADNSWAIGFAGNINAITAALTNRFTGALSTNTISYEDSNGPVTPARTFTVSWTGTSSSPAIQAYSFSPFVASTIIHTLASTGVGR